MMKRVTWFVGGVAAGAVGAGAAKRRVKAAAAELTPAHLVHKAGGTVRRGGRRVSDAVREGRRAARAREIELRGRLDGQVATLADELDDADGIHAVLVDGEEVEPGKVIVLRQVRPPGEAKRPRRRA